MIEPINGVNDRQIQDHFNNLFSPNIVSDHKKAAVRIP